MSDVTNSIDDKKQKKRDNRILNTFLQSVQDIESNEEKIQSLGNKYLEIYNENKLLDKKNSELQKKSQNLDNQRITLQNDLNKSILAKKKLEDLCRELQRMNKTIKDESIMMSKETEERRQEVSASFQVKINEIQAQITEYHEQNQKLRQENDNLTGKMTEILSLFEKRALDMEECLRQKDKLLNEVQQKYKSREELILNEHSKQQAELQKYQSEMLNFQGKCLVMEELDKKRQEQSDVYKEKYTEILESITQSHKIYETCKTEMDKMSKKIFSLEKENIQLKSKFENSEKSVLILAKEKMDYDKNIEKMKSRNLTLENLCRTLQTKLRVSPPNEEKQNNPQKIDTAESNTQDQPSVKETDKLSPCDFIAQPE